MIRPALFNHIAGLEAGFTTRAFAGIGEKADTSRQRLSGQLGFDAVATADQVHGSKVVVVNGAGHVIACDGLVTQHSDLLLTVVSADCALVLLADKESGVLGACHAGWRGTVGGVLANTIRAMSSLGASSSHILAYVAPCISMAAFEVGEEVAEQFDSSVVERRPSWPRPHVDLRAELLRHLRTEGVLEGNIEIDPACTASETDRFYSHRAERGTTGRMFGFIGRRNVSTTGTTA